MAFTPSRPQSATPAVSSKETEKSVLHSDRSGASKLSDTQVQKAEDNARVAALRTMNAVRMLGPVLSKVAAEGGSDEDQAYRFSSLMEKTHGLAVDAALVLGFTPTDERDRWALNVLERTFADVLSKNLEEPSGRQVVRSLAAAAKSRATDIPIYQDIGEDVSLTMARIQAMGPVLRAQAAFDFARPKDQTIAEVLGCLDDEVVKAMEALVEPLAGAPERRTLFSVLSQEGGELMAEAWHHEAAKAIAALRKKTLAEREAWKKANPQGLPIETVLARFRQQMGRLVKLTRQLRPSTKKPARK
jgi:hypothetical protein